LDPDVASSFDSVYAGVVEYALLMDMADIGGNVKDGCHIAALGGSWMAAVYGRADMRDRGGAVSFHSRSMSRGCIFWLTMRNRRLEVRIDGGSATYLLHGARLV
jgi:alpha,alpha-trehalose phosphorylase